MEKSCSPQNDLDCHINESWRQNVLKIQHELKLPDLSISNFEIIQYQINKKLMEWISDLQVENTDNSIQAEIAHMYHVYPERNSIRSNNFFRKLTRMIGSITDFQTFAMSVKTLMQYQIETFFEISLAETNQHPNTFVWSIGQFPLTLKVESYTKEYLANYHNFGEKIYKIYLQVREWGYTCCAKTFMRNILELELLFSKINYDQIRNSQSWLNRNAIPVKTFLKKYDANHFWAEIFRNYDYHTLVYENGAYLTFLQRFFQTLRPERWRMIRDYLIYSVARKFADNLGLDDAESQDIGTVMGDAIFLNTMTIMYGTELQSAFEASISQTEAHDKKIICSEIATSLVAYLAQEINASRILSPLSKKKILQKISKLSVIIGCVEYAPTVSMPYQHLNFYQILAKRLREMWRQKCQYIGKRVEIENFGVTERVYSHQVNAFYDQSQNTVFVPTAILDNIFCDHKQDLVYNYGGIGIILGHEIMHAFDTRCIHYNGMGELDVCLTDADYEKYLQECRKINHHYNELFAKYSNQSQNLSQISLSENLADVMGIKLSFRCCFSKIYDCDVSQLTPEEKLKIGKFFARWAQSFRNFESKPSLSCQRQGQGQGQDQDQGLEHAPQTMRINAPFSHISEYYAIFAVGKKHQGYVEPEHRAVLLYD